jgi:sulfate/thiosulfate-binding protein
MTRCWRIGWWCCWRLGWQSAVWAWLAAGVCLTLTGCFAPRPGLLNVSYDPTRELYRELNAHFADQQAQQTGTRPTIRQSHGGSSSQARAVIDGLPADVVTLALWSDIDALVQRGLIAPGWEDRLPHRSLPFTSTVIFLVRRGNPKRIADWPDLARPGVSVITPNPKTSGNGKLSFLAAWGAVVVRGGSELEALALLRGLYANVPVLDTGARGATVTFVQKGLGDVLIAWENEALAELARHPDKLEAVYPPVSLRAEPYVAWVDANVQRRGTAALAEDYLRFLYTPAAQECAAKHGYRPSDAAVLARHADRFPTLTFFSITDVMHGSGRPANPGDWGVAQERFFAEGAIFDQLFTRDRKR